MGRLFGSNFFSLGGGDGEVMVPVEVYEGRGAVADLTSTVCGLGDRSCRVEDERGGWVGRANCEACSALGDVTELKTSSAKASVTRLLSFSCAGSEGGAVGSNSNLLPFSWRMENSSKDGNLLESSSTAAARTGWDGLSKAAKGSLDAPRAGEGLGLAARDCCCCCCCCCCCDGGGTRPRRPGTTSGMDCLTCTGSAFWRPMIGDGDEVA
jgi:hypothetical protein